MQLDKTVSGASVPRAYRIAGIPVVDATIEEALGLIWSDVTSGGAHAFVFANAYSSTLRREEPAYAAALEHEGSICLPDGAPLALAGRAAKEGRFARCPGPDLFEAASARAASDKASFFLLGGGPGTAEKLAQQLSQRHQGLRIAGTCTPPFGAWTESDDARLLERIRVAAPSVVWMGVSAPKQEIWAVRNLGSIGVPVVCVGAAFDFLSGNKPRAPHWMRSLGLEWLFRLASEPRRLWKRYLIGNTRFLIDLMRLGARRDDREAAQ